MPDFTAFKRLLWRAYQHAPHLAVIDSALTDIATHIETNGADGIGHLAIFIPPRHGKSQTVARLFPAWFLGRNPDKRVILTGYGASLVDKHSRAVRNLLLTDAYGGIFPKTRVATDSAARAAWDVADHTGGMDAAGIGGAITGKGADLLLIDDPVKNRQEAESAVMRERVWESYASDLYTRLEPGGAVVLIMTRWHPDDLGGRLLAREPENWTVIRLPALAEPDDPLGRAVGEALWTARYSVAKLEKTRASIGSHAFAALYQQRPLFHEGALFRAGWIKRAVSAPELHRVVVAVDPPASATGAEAGIIGAGVSMTDQRIGVLYVLADVSLRGTPDAWARAAVALYHQLQADALVVETNQGGDMVEHTLRTIDPAVRIRRVSATRGKMLRAEPVAALYEQGRAYHVGVFPHLEEQMAQWSPADSISPDRLDALVWAATELVLRGKGSVIG